MIERSSYLLHRVSGAEKLRRSTEVQRSTFARFLGLFDFRLLQQYRHVDGPAKHAAHRCRSQRRAAGFAVP
jgi:hypothetical protein